MKPLSLNLLSKICIVLIIAILCSCGGGGGEGENGSSPSPLHSVTPLAYTSSGSTYDIYLENGRIYYPEHDRGSINSVSTDGGDVASHYLGLGLFFSPWRVVSAEGKIYILNSISHIGGILSLPDSAVGISYLVKDSSGVLDIVSNEKYVYWTAGTKIYRNQINQTFDSTFEVVFDSSNQGSSGRIKIVLDGESLYAFETSTRDIYRIDLLSGESELIASGIGSDTLSWVEMVVTSQFLYLMDQDLNIHSVDKYSGKYEMLLKSSHNFTSNKIPIESTGDTVYWWWSDVSNLALHRLNSQTGQTDIIVTIPFTWHFIGFLPEGQNVYWFTYDYDSVGDQIIHVWKTNIVTRVVEEISSFNGYFGTNGGMAPNNLASDGENLYWTSPSANVLIKMPISGGTPEVVTNLVGFGANISITGDSIYLGDSEGVKNVPMTGLTNMTEEWAMPSSSFIPEDMTRDESHLFWIVQNPSTSEFPWGTFDVYSMPTIGAEATMLATIQDHGDKVFAYKEYLYFIKDLPASMAISRMLKSGGPEELIFEGEKVLGDITDIYIHDDILYFTFQGLHAVDLNTKTLNTLIKTDSQINQLYADSDYIYLSKINGYGTGGVFRLPVSGGSIETIYSGLPCWKIVGDFENIYWAAGSRIFKAKK